MAERAQSRQRGHLPLGPVVEARVVDRPGDERRHVYEQIEYVLTELARRLGVQNDDADHVAVPIDERDRDHRLKALLVELGYVAHTWVFEGFLLDERWRPVASDPTGQSFADAQAYATHRVCEYRRGGPDRQPVALTEVDKHA